MASTIFINSIVHYGSDIRLNPFGGELLIQKSVGGTWITLRDLSAPGTSENKFRVIVESSQLKFQQLMAGGSWTGTEGVDFKSIEGYDKII